MPVLSQKSKRVLSTCHDDLKKICETAIQITDFKVLEGYRDEATQEKYYKEGKSKAHFGESKHNSVPSLAIDVVPWFDKDPNIRWDDLEAFNFLLGVITAVAKIYNVNIRLGKDFKNLPDYPHIEII